MSSSAHERARQKVDDLRVLVSKLPPSLPEALGPNISLDGDLLAEEGYWYALNNCLEASWGYKHHGFAITSRGMKLDSTVALFDMTLPHLSVTDIPLVELWIDTFIDVVKQAGAKVDVIPSPSKASTVADQSKGKGAPIRGQLHVLSPTCMRSFLIKVSRKKPKNATSSQARLGFRTLSTEEAAVQSKHDWERMKAQSEKRRQAEEVSAERKKLEKREYERVKKQKQRAEKRGKLVPGNSANHAIELDNSESDAEASARIEQDRLYAIKQKNAKHSSVGKTTEKNRLHRAKKKGVDVSTMKRHTNWQHWVYWLKIERAQEVVDEWSAERIVKALHQHDPELFAGKGGLSKGVLHKWFARDKDGQAIGWSEATLNRALNGQRPGPVSRSKALEKYPHIKEAVKSQLTAIRAAGLPVQGPLARMVLRAHIMHQQPSLLEPLSGFKLSMTWVRKFLRDELGWAERVATRQAKKVPANAKELCTRAHNRLTFAMAMNNVPPELVVNADQSGVTMMPTGKRTYEKKGAKNVPMLSHEEKRQFTVVLASSMDGDILPFQSIWGGGGPASLPSRTAEHYQEADAKGFKYGHGDTRHWSSLQTTKDWIEEIYDPYITRKKEKLGLPADAKSILLLDVWPVHIGNSKDDDFIPWMRRTHPNVIVLYIPGGCTGIFQPADVVLQRLMKHIIKLSATDFFVAFVTRQLREGVAPDKTVVPHDLPTLRNASISWLLDAYSYFQANPELVRSAWAKCRTGNNDELNLLYASVSSSAAREAMQHAMRTDAVFSGEIARFNLDIVTGDLAAECDDETNTRSEIIGHDDDLALSADDLQKLLVPEPQTVQQHLMGISTIKQTSSGDFEAKESGAESADFEDIPPTQDELEQARATQLAIHTADDDREDDSDDSDNDNLLSKNVEAMSEYESEWAANDTSGRNSPTSQPPLSSDVEMSYHSGAASPIDDEASRATSPEPSRAPSSAPSSPSRAPSPLTNIALLGGTNYAALRTPDELATKNPRGKNKRKPADGGTAVGATPGSRKKPKAAENPTVESSSSSLSKESSTRGSGRERGRGRGRGRGRVGG